MTIREGSKVRIKPYVYGYGGEVGYAVWQDDSGEWVVDTDAASAEEAHGGIGFMEDELVVIDEPNSKDDISERLDDLEEKMKAVLSEIERLKGLLP